MLSKKENVMNKQDLTKKIAQLESINDMLLTELGYVDHLMRLVGFSEGIATVKVTAKELYQSDARDRSDSNE